MEGYRRNNWLILKRNMVKICGGDESMDRTRFYTPECDGLPEIQKGPLQSTPKSGLNIGVLLLRT